MLYQATDNTKIMKNEIGNHTPKSIGMWNKKNIICRLRDIIPRFSGKVCNAVPSCLMWNLLRERNRRTFETRNYLWTDSSHNM